MKTLNELEVCGDYDCKNSQMTPDEYCRKKHPIILHKDDLQREARGFQNKPPTRKMVRDTLEPYETIIAMQKAYAFETKEVHAYRR